MDKVFRTILIVNLSDQNHKIVSVYREKYNSEIDKRRNA